MFVIADNFSVKILLSPYPMNRKFIIKYGHYLEGSGIFYMCIEFIFIHAGS